MIFPHSHRQPLPGAVPVGTVCAYLGVIDVNHVLPGNQPVACLERLGWLSCAGQTVPIAQYPELFGALGTLYGEAEAGKFRLPDCRGMFLRGVDDGSTTDPDAQDRQGPAGAGSAIGAVGSTQRHATQYHTHDYTTYTAGAATAQGNPAVLVEQTGQTPTGAMNVDYQSQNETRPVNIAVNFIIRAR